MAIKINKQNPLTEDRLDVQKTLGKLEFLGYEDDRLKTEDGEYTGEVDAVRAGVFSENLNDVLVVFLPPTLEKQEIGYKKEVVLEGVQLSPYTTFSLSRNNVVQFKVQAEAIKPIETANQNANKPSDDKKQAQKA
ncbi:hypothetical protein MFLO_04290 [Listeria floridensis FSL S10-1187]|uniref:Conjugative transposon protein n=1 Tax=Listeria floridensis FSL S10-1187 TaxID=1265817 RepID=A0ABP3B1D1_9LIST|nr:DUF961 family protein [Listeria floridensis]EUJ33131.1 hypothetical protein MFLO_04290 [Listeria floridensis FSL S10-1187]